MRVLIAILLFGLIGCASTGPTVSTNKNPNKDFASYRSFGFLQPLDTDRGNGVRTIVSNQLISSMRKELESRGLREDAAPDLLVNFYINIENRVRVEQVRTASSHGHYRRGRYNTWQNYRTVETRYTVGTLAIDLIDASTNILAWEGFAVGRLRQNPGSFTQEQVDSIVGAVMTDFPVAPTAADSSQE